MRSGRVFLSYRREDAAFPAAWLYERLVGRFGPGEVFKDVDSIDFGDDFAEVIRTAVSSCDVLVAVIGPEWATITDAGGHRRLDDPNDFVRLEIEAALQRDVRVVPILVEGARLPRAEQLPGSLAKLVRRQAMELSPNQFEYDTTRLLRVIENTIAQQPRQSRTSTPQEGPESVTEQPSGEQVAREASARGQLRRRHEAEHAAAQRADPPHGLAVLHKSKRSRITALAGLGAVVALTLLVLTLTLWTHDTGQPTTGQPTTGQPTTGQPTTGQPTTGQPLRIWKWAPPVSPIPPGIHVRVHTAPSINATNLAEVYEGTFAAIVCGVSGENVSSYAGSSSDWDYVSSPAVGWVAGVFLNTKGYTVPRC